MDSVSHKINGPVLVTEAHIGTPELDLRLQDDGPWVSMDPVSQKRMTLPHASQVVHSLHCKVWRSHSNPKVRVYWQRGLDDNVLPLVRQPLEESEISADAVAPFPATNEGMHTHPPSHPTPPNSPFLLPIRASPTASKSPLSNHVNQQEEGGTLNMVAAETEDRKILVIVVFWGNMAILSRSPIFFHVGITRRWLTRWQLWNYMWSLSASSKSCW